MTPSRLAAGGPVRRAVTWIERRTVRGTDGLTRARRDAMARRHLTAVGVPLLDAEQLERLHETGHKGRRERRSSPRSTT